MACVNRWMLAKNCQLYGCRAKLDDLPGVSSSRLGRTKGACKPVMSCTSRARKTRGVSSRPPCGAYQQRVRSAFKQLDPIRSLKPKRARGVSGGAHDQFHGFRSARSWPQPGALESFRGAGETAGHISAAAMSSATGEMLDDTGPPGKRAGLYRTASDFLGIHPSNGHESVSLQRSDRIMHTLLCSIRIHDFFYFIARSKTPCLVPAFIWGNCTTNPSRPTGPGLPHSPSTTALWLFSGLPHRNLQ